MLKEIIKNTFPNITGIIQLYKEIHSTRKQIYIVKKLHKNNWPSYLQKYYLKKTGHELNLDSPQRFTEKVQWRKLFDNDPVYSILSDKYRVRSWVRKKIGEKYLIPLLGYWKNYKDINFDTLPNKFVLKTNNGCHSNIIIKDKYKFLRGKWAAGKKINHWLTPNNFYIGLEMHYFQIKPLIIAEQYIDAGLNADCLTDYKFHCFNGKPVMCEVIEGRTTNETVDYYDCDWNHLPVSNPPHPVRITFKEKPENYDLMVQLARKLSEGFQYVRVDLYDNGNVYFGEMTFTPASGLDKYDPDDWDYKLGHYWDIHTSQIDYSLIKL